jgi:hypothetical protein
MMDEDSHFKRRSSSRDVSRYRGLFKYFGTPEETSKGAMPVNRAPGNFKAKLTSVGAYVGINVDIIVLTEVLPRD